MSGVPRAPAALPSVARDLEEPPGHAITKHPRCRRKEGRRQPPRIDEGEDGGAGWAKGREEGESLWDWLVGPTSIFTMVRHVGKSGK